MTLRPCAVPGCTGKTNVPKGLCPWHEVNGTPADIKHGEKA